MGIALVIALFVVSVIVVISRLRSGVNDGWTKLFIGIAIISLVVFVFVGAITFFGPHSTTPQQQIIPRK